MKKNSGKKSLKSNAAPARTTKGNAKTKTKLPSKEPITTGENGPSAASTSPFAPAAASPMSKESQVPVQRSTATRERPKQETEPAASSNWQFVPSKQGSASRSVEPEKGHPTANPSKSTSLVPEREKPSAMARVPLVEEATKVAPAPSPKSVKIKPGKRPPRTGDTRKREMPIPSILLEGDLPPNPSASGPGFRYALAPSPVAVHPSGGAGELPEAYGTGRVFAAARDPHWLYVSWDFSAEQQSQYNALSRDGHLVVKVFARGEGDVSVPDVHVHPESRNWFVHVPHAETLYRAEVGFYDKAGIWKITATSQSTFTPPETPSPDVSATFATIPPEVTFQQVVEAVQQFVAVSNNEPLLEAVAQAQSMQLEHRESSPSKVKSRNAEPPHFSVTRIEPAGEARSGQRHGRHKASIRPIPIQVTSGPEWSQEQTRALTKLIHIDSFRRVWLGSMEITELVRLQLQEEIASIAAAEARRAAIQGKIPGGLFELGISSPAGGEVRKPAKFWFKVNAELIIYGATEPDASVTIADRLIKLRQDGTFSFRFSLPDGRYQLPVLAISSNREEGRGARLEFSRSTDYHGHVEPHPQDSALHPPRGENIS